MIQDEFKNRYLIKLSSSVLIVALNAVVQILLPRVFSVEEYGYYTYNLNIFTSVVSVANLSASNAMVSKFAKRNEEIGLILFYLKFYFVVTVILTLIVIVLYPFRWMQEVLVGQTLLMALLGLEAAAATKLMTDSVGMFDAMAVSRFPAAVQVLQKLLLTAAILFGYLAGKLNLLYFYVIQAGFTLCIVIYMLAALLRAQRKLYPVRSDYGIRKYMQEYYRFCRPLIASGVFSQIIVILMNWALMRWAGSTEQAMFGAAWQLNTLISYVFSPYAELSKREFAVAVSAPSLLKLRYRQALKLMMWLTSYFAVFIAFTSQWILPVIYGESYTSAVMVTFLIMFYTIYQAWGQISGAFLLAVENTKASAWISVLGQISMMLCMFLFQIPNFIWPKGLGSMGIALTYLISNGISVSVCLFVNSRLLRIPFLEIISIQFVPVSLYSATILLLRQVLNEVWSERTVGSCFVKLMVSGVLYTLAVGNFIWLKPQMLGMTREGLRSLIRFGNHRS